MDISPAGAEVTPAGCPLPCYSGKVLEVEEESLRLAWNTLHPEELFVLQMCPDTTPWSWRHCGPHCRGIQLTSMASRKFPLTLKATLDPLDVALFLQDPPKPQHQERAYWAPVTEGGAMCCSVGGRCGLDLALLWLWRRLAAVAPI